MHTDGEYFNKPLMEGKRRGFERQEEKRRYTCYNKLMLYLENDSLNTGYTSRDAVFYM